MAISGPGTPYVTPEQLKDASTGIAWSTIPRKGANPQQQLAEQLNMCQRATGMCDAITNQVIRATIDTETLSGPDYRVTIQQSTGNVRMLCSRWPVLSVTNVNVTPNIFPRQWTTLPAGYYEPEIPVVGLYGTSAPSASGEGGQSILIAPWANWCLGRNGFRIQATYVNGWPHTSTTGTSIATATQLAVDDCTGWAPPTPGAQGATGTIQDGGGQETITCTAATAVSGPGTLTLGGPLAYAHTQGIVVTTLPAQVQWAAILLAVGQALERGSTATTVQQLPGSSSSVSISSIEEADVLARGWLKPFERTI